jgi:hypothetical protein
LFIRYVVEPIRFRHLSVLGGKCKNEKIASAGSDSFPGPQIFDVTQSLSYAGIGAYSATVLIRFKGSFSGPFFPAGHP